MLQEILMIVFRRRLGRSPNRLDSTIERGLFEKPPGLTATAAIKILCTRVLLTADALTSFTI